MSNGIDELRWFSTLFQHEKRGFSQGGEDGVIAEVFRRFGTTNKFAVEFGAEHASEQLPTIVGGRRVEDNIGQWLRKHVSSPQRLSLPTFYHGGKHCRDSLRARGTRETGFSQHGH